MRPRLLVVTGPTASGKTAVAIEIAERLGGELVGCDSVQVYRGFDVGSAKPTRTELRGVPHHLIDVVDPDEPIDAMRYAALADRAIAEVAARSRVPIVVGGAGLWLRALLRGLVEVPLPDPAIRAELEKQLARLGAPALHERLRAVDPLAAAKIHRNDGMRIVRALEVHAQTGVPLGELRRRHALGTPRYEALLVALDRPRDELAARIDARIDEMLRRGWLDEVRALLARWGREVRPFHSVGYRELAAHVLDGVAWDQTLRALRKATRIYARRQRTWIASDPDVRWRAVPEELLADPELERIRAFLEGTAREEPRA